MSRPKSQRTITKPPRYQTTSSEDEVPRRGANARKQPAIEEDIRDLREVFTSNCSQIDDDNLHLHTQSQQMHTQNQEIHTQNQQAHTQNQQAHTQNQQMHTHNQQTHTQNQPMHIQNQQIHTQNQQMHTHNQQIDTQNEHVHTQNQQIYIQNHQMYNTQNSQLYAQSSEANIQTPTNYPQQICSRQMETSHESRIHYSQHTPTPSHTLNTNQNIFQNQPHLSHVENRLNANQNIYRNQPHSSHAENNGQYLITEERLEIMESQLRILNDNFVNLNENIQRILKCVQDRDRCRITQKVSCLPFSTEKDVQDFENVDDATYNEVVNYLQYIGGFTAKEAVNLCFKEVMENQTTTAFTWFGREEDSLPLYNTRIIKAIYAAVSDNKHFEKPTRSEFQRYLREALRAAKQRQRTHNRKKDNGNRNKERNAAQEYWADEDNNSLDNEADETMEQN
ncbi:putative uncharacterized protein DDB_G0282133 [Temnothorax curvispinosus]|uniref:DUF4806 domain-containing protein n=1 Tax=Temnothorax curvispinosus TaxID=300111 RepID=A0A6J1PQ73_9HYME|nr:putative uncharacterized protein DDB_G0282133 [Temnothorax curvispinosus]